ncbi:cadherin-like domain-containing protein, partial [Mycolicibacterium sp. BiH015]|uniref:cadherin-like domain-containing protein n=1 Tax=Mycolicibacterium sp. BiH015 TaxID=3018808 RepID=UPI0022E6E7A9
VDDTKTLSEDTPRTFTVADLLWNDTDPDKPGGDVLSFHSVSAAVNGTVTLNTDGTITFTPTTNYNGTASFTYKVKDTAGAISANSATVTLNVTPVNDPPTAVNDSKTINSNSAYTFTAAELVSNDTDVENSSLSVHSVSGATNGTVVLNANGTVTFTPTAGYRGSASFTYKVKDTAGAVSNAAIVAITVNAVPVAVNDTKTLSEDTPRTFTVADLLWNDTDPDKPGGDVLSFHSVSAAVNGTVTLNTDGTITFTPTTNYNGTASFTYKVKDTAGAISANSATVTLNVTPVNDPPTA